MTPRRASIALALALLVGACIPPATPPPASSGSPSPPSTSTASPVARASPPPSPAPTPPTILAIAPAQRPSGPWAVTFQLIGTEAVQEVYVLSSACVEATCDIDAAIQTFAGEALGTGVFRYADGMYRYEGDRIETVACSDGFEDVPNGATRASHTILLIAGYRPVGTAVVSVDIRGTRSVQITPVGGSGCSPESLDYTANGHANQFAAGPTATPQATPPPEIPASPASLLS